LIIQFKSWAKSDHENLTIENATNWINNAFLNEWTAKELTNYKISYPVSKHIVASRMKEAGFHYAVGMFVLEWALSPVLSQTSESSPYFPMMDRC